MKSPAPDQPKIPATALPIPASAKSTAEQLSATVLYPHGADPHPSILGDAEVFAPGTLLKHFRIVRLIGRGGMGDVYEATDESLERTVALKVIQAGKQIATTDHARLIHEARSQARINHPHVVQIYYVGLEPDCPFLAMEFVIGKTLAESLREQRPSFRNVVRIALEVTRALAKANEMGIVHADIKPSNIILDQAGTAKLSDFGLARPVSADPSRTTGLTGTPKYMAPELFTGLPNSAASDMYSLGITLFEMTFGSYPYADSATSFSQQITLHRTADIEFPKPWPEGIPEGWRSVLERLLAKQPTDRFASYAELRAAISQFRPTTRLPAGLLPRALAWTIDFGLLLATLGMFGVTEFLLRLGLDKLLEIKLDYLVGLLVFLAQAGAFVLMSIAHAKFKITPGKRLFQISIADSHGLDLVPARLVPRLILSQFPVTLILFMELIDRLTGEAFGWLVPTAVAVMFLWFIGNAVSVLLASSRLALHDRILGSRVVVDQAESQTPVTA
ncbi:MAG: protein kinase [Planctomycetes bacterium]|nr:protein kinase [Planctomycetota bacterium]